MKSLKETDVQGKRVLVRCDFNVPLDEKGNILDDFRIQRALPTVRYLIDRKAKIILMSHLGEPEGIIVPELRLDKVSQKLSEHLGFDVKKSDDCVGLEVERQALELKIGEVMLLENLRFHKEEMENDAVFAENLSRLGDIYVNDAFGVCHRNHSSVSKITEFIYSCAGLLLEKEIASLDRVIKNPEKPFVVLIGGKKVATKEKFINEISRHADTVILNGLIEHEAELVKDSFDFPEKILTPEGDLNAFDINKKTIKIFSERILSAKTILWNGPFGKFEDKKYEKGTLSLAKAIIKSKAFSVVGGGETVEFLSKHGMIDKFSHVSTGGGAMLDYLSGEKLPGIEALNKIS